MKTYFLLFVFFWVSSSYAISQTRIESGYLNHQIEDNYFSFEKDKLQDSIGLYGIRRNAIYDMDILLICYERIFPLKDRFGLRLTGGVLIWDPFNLVGEFGGLVGGPLHFGEIGIGYNLNPFDSDWNMALYRIGYRLQLKKGFLAKASVAYVNDPLGSFVPLLGVGYAF